MTRTRHTTTSTTAATPTMPSSAQARRPVRRRRSSTGGRLPTERGEVAGYFVFDVTQGGRTRRILAISLGKGAHDRRRGDGLGGAQPVVVRVPRR